MKTAIPYAKHTFEVNGKTWVKIAYKARLDQDNFRELMKLLYAEASAKFIEDTKSMVCPEKDWLEFEKWLNLSSTQKNYPYFYLDEDEDIAEFVAATKED